MIENPSGKSFLCHRCLATAVSGERKKGSGRHDTVSRGLRHRRTGTVRIIRSRWRRGGRFDANCIKKESILEWLRSWRFKKRKGINRNKPIIYATGPG